MRDFEYNAFSAKQKRKGKIRILHCSYFSGNKRHNDDFLTIHSGDFLNVNPEHGLTSADVWKFIKLES